MNSERRQKQKKWALTPKFRVRSSSSFDTLSAANNSFNLRMNAQFGIKNTNFGPYKYDNTTVTFFYKGTPVGSTTVRKSKANFRRTKKGSCLLTSQSRLTGKIEIMFIFKKKRATNMNCTMDVNIAQQVLQNIKCK
ncbi:hypothetical protein Acr_03g0000740 [Actinidia rufa]|uniref:Late embryogenesis abundant (LEA) hydroxyproline-rich glycoprotein family n=1 Tax=Actinidia rufa TaxID=165716 RepID=A0A7J0EA75_9ERIC|nr:hypothetical protein Acr_03g0000740 [Actinidia rufa]